MTSGHIVGGVLISRSKRSTTYCACVQCVMDTSDPEIAFDSEGVCNHCHKYDDVRRQAAAPEPARRQRLERFVARVRAEGVGKDYDCIIGVSGGVDSTYLAYLVQRWGLRPLAVHMDNGWNSELAVHNIERALRRLKIDLYTEVVDWQEFRDLHRAFLKASVINSEIPTDHAIMAVLFRVARQQKLRFILGGSNNASEGVMPRSWVYTYRDLRNLRAIHKRFGSVPLRTYPQLSIPQYLYHTFVRRIRIVPVLDLIDYDKQEAIRVLRDQLGWREYGGKHYESIYTRFYQAYILFCKFGVDKRRAHLSALICGGQLDRESAMQQLRDPPADEGQLREDRAYVLDKLGFTDAEFDALLAQPQQRHQDYPSNWWLLRSLSWMARVRRHIRHSVG